MCPVPPAGARLARPGRRALLLGVLGGGVLGLAGCRVRLEDNAPIEIPFVPTREPIPAEEALTWLMLNSRHLASTEVGEHGLYREQVDVLRTALYRAGVPISTLDRGLAVPEKSPAVTAGPAPTATTAPTIYGTAVPTEEPSADPTETEVPVEGEAPVSPTAADPDPEDAQPTAAPPEPEPALPAPRGAALALRRIDELSTCGAGLFPIVASVLSQRWATVDLIGAGAPDLLDEAPADRAWPEPTLAADYVALTHPVEYGLQVVAAQTRDETREQALIARDRLRELIADQSARAGGTVPEAAIGYHLPVVVDSPESALELATHLLGGLVAGYGALLESVAGDSQPLLVRDAVTWLGTATSLAASFGVPVSPFPGLQDP
ncbi:MAG: DUF4439 domain-containing protein [Actinomycetia bacterium]|nr:DUF4439 domain-containing protein [Actinomycetes bacterium]